jgi:hypothetical protein
MSIRRALLAILVAATCTAALAQEHITGSFRAGATTAELFDPASAESLSNIVSEGEEVQWQVFVPESYDSDRPPGILIYLDPDGWGGMPDQYRQLFTNRNMIWIGAKSNQRKPDVSKTMLKAIMAQRFLDQNYAVDLNRLFIGSSGDEAYAALNVLLRANEFNGAIYINGSAYWNSGMPETFNFLVEKPHVFIIGSGDERWQQVRRDYENYKKDGIENVELIYRSGTIRDWPDIERMDEALAYLDAH